MSDIEQLRLFFNENREIILITLGLIGGLLEGGRRKMKRMKKAREEAAQACQPCNHQPEASPQPEQPKE